ncbi:hypothetical protein [Leptospira andrefontaineae]|uniref:Lipoprotein n=1 Tax=Leptospira andrefontaineae TaxID=2484976 RepID=A0A4R9HAV3_9LEPT|nr:hypothetical protein [Leptospira andrefontaineae]TGK43544.1 hypothetical protein EHO65_02575 [Leptospira andrefontaineae]
MKFALKHFFLIFPLLLLGAISCKKEITFSEGIVYLPGNEKVEKQFKAIGVDPKKVASEQLLKSILELKNEGINEKDGSILVYLSSIDLGKAMQAQYKFSDKYDALHAWVASFKTAKTWCDYHLLFKDKIVSFEIEPIQAYKDNVFPDGSFDKVLKYNVYLRKQGEMGKLTSETAYTLVFTGELYKDGDWSRFSISSFEDHGVHKCPIREVDPETEHEIEQIKQRTKELEAEGKL